jgi:cyclopropane-fatty-acyl-phospholipid synthase
MNMMITAKHHSQANIGIPWIEKLLGQQLFKAIGPAPIRFVLKDGTEISPGGSSPVGTVFIHDNRTLAKLAIDPEIAFGEAYAEGRVHVNGDLVRLLEAVYQSMGAAPEGRYERLTSKWMNWWQANTLHGSRSNIHRHYDLGNDFYKLWLDPQMIYTCAYFVSPQATLEEAQEAKLDYICRKLQLRSGETVVEAGCGWGALALHMAQHYGVSVKAFNISHQQILFARRAAAERGLSGQVEFIEDDYRNIPSGFDAFVSVGMLEHVDPKRFGDFGEVIYGAVGDTGRGLLHFIGRSHQGNFSRWIRKRIFPGAHAPSLAEAMNILQPRRYSVLDVENLRPHYARTLEHWLDRFEASGPQVVEMYGAWFQRAWRLYLAGSIAGFRAGTLQLFQITFAGSKRQSSSWTRAPLYSETGH